MTTLPTTALGTVNTLGNYTITGTEPVIDLVGSANDGTYVGDGVNSSGSENVYVEVGNTPADFSAMLTLSIRLRYFWVTDPGANMTWDALNVRIYNSAQTSVLADGGGVILPITISPTTTPTNSSVTAFSVTAAGLAASKTDWDGALLQVQITKTRQKGGSSAVAAISAGELTGTYTATAPATSLPHERSNRRRLVMSLPIYQTIPLGL